MSLQTAPAIGVFDSGVGGLSIYASIKKRLPEARFAYCSDNAHFPYGGREEADVVKCVVTACERFVAAAGLDILVLACNTASTAALPTLRATFKIPVVGVVPAIKPAASLTKTKVIALLATPGTVKRSYTDDLVSQHAGGTHVVRVGSSLLVEMAEAKLRGTAPDKAVLKREIEPIFTAKAPAKVDVVVLGCTHFPLLMPELAEVAAWPVTWLDSGDAVAARVSVVTHELIPPPPKLLSPTAYFTRLDASAEGLTAALKEYGFSSLAAV